MAIYYKFKSARDYDTISMDGPFVSVGFLKEKIYQTKHLGSGKDLDIVISNAQTNEEYLDEAMLIPKNTSVLIRRVPGRPRIRIITQQEPRVEEKVQNVQVENVQTDMINLTTADASVAEDEWDEFGNDLYTLPDAPPPVHYCNPSIDPAPADEKVDEETKLKALIDTPALDWQHQGAVGFGPGRGYGRGVTARMGPGGRGFGMERNTPPPGYICHRCNVPGHLIQHCPTNGDPNYDVKRVKPPTGIPKSMLMATPDGSYSLPSGAVAVLKPNEDAFERDMEGLPSTTRSVGFGELPPELKCPLCKEVMRDAALTSKCCFQSFCDKCIRDHIIAKAKCVCGSTNVLADDLLPNKTLRDTINRILESGNSSAENAGSMCQVQDMESARCPPPKVQSPTTSAASRGEKKPVPSNNNTSTILKPLIEIAEITSAPRESESAGIVKVEEPVNASETTQGSLNGKEAGVEQVNTQTPNEVTPQQVAPVEQGKKKKKKARMPGTDMQWNPMPNLAGPEYMMPMGPGNSNQYFNGMQPGFNGMQPGFNGVQPGFNGMQPGFNGVQPGFNGFHHHGYNPGGIPPFAGYRPGPMDMSYSGMMHHQGPFATQGFGFPNIPPPHRDLAEMGNRMNPQRPIMGREEFEARKAEMKRKLENERRSEGGNFMREVGESNSRMVNHSAASYLPMKSKTRQGPPPPTSENDRRMGSERYSPERHSSRRRFSSPPRASSKKFDHREGHHEADRKRHHHHHSKRSEKPSSEPIAATMFAEDEKSTEKKRKTFKSSEIAAVSSIRRHSRKKEEDSGSDDEDVHFKRKRSRHERSSPQVSADHFRHSKRSKGEISNS
ncbi:unnamed protein product [Cochlearia groenlandica]